MNEGEIRMQAQLFSLIADMYATVAEVEGMKAENAQRQICGESMAYIDHDFFTSSRALQLIAARIKEEI
jgi:hypothetical protein